VDWISVYGIDIDLLVVVAHGLTHEWTRACNVSFKEGSKSKKRYLSVSRVRVIHAIMIDKSRHRKRDALVPVGQNVSSLCIHNESCGL